METTTLSEAIRKEALDLGFSKVGIAPAERLEPEGKHLLEWLASGYHGSMDWMARNAEKRINPEDVLPGARSVVAVAMNYYANVKHSRETTRGKISRYAWGDDYHAVLGRRLDRLLDFIRSLDPAAMGKVYVDTGPVLDKAWAQRAGIGWEGKHTNVITPEYGSWVFLGEVILNMELEYDAPASDHCGSCTLCIEACPTQAIVEPYVLDSNRCISYLTIEHRGGIPEEFNEKFDNWIYGCDICQDVCPWNQKFSVNTDGQEFSPREFNVAPSLEEWSAMTHEEFAGKFRRSPIKRTKFEGLQRNVDFVKKHQDA